jgi:hypothetical protein
MSGDVEAADLTMLQRYRQRLDGVPGCSISNEIDGPSLCGESHVICAASPPTAKLRGLSAQ